MFLFPCGFETWDSVINVSTEICAQVQLKRCTVIIFNQYFLSFPVATCSRWEFVTISPQMGVKLIDGSWRRPSLAQMLQMLLRTGLRHANKERRLLSIGLQRHRDLCFWFVAIWWAVCLIPSLVGLEVFFGHFGCHLDDSSSGKHTGFRAFNLMCKVLNFVQRQCDAAISAHTITLFICLNLTKCFLRHM